MALLLAPYTNAMRLGIFNSYTQQICIDNATTIDEHALENVVNNTGMKMKELAQQIKELKSFESEILLPRHPSTLAGGDGDVKVEGSDGSTKEGEEPEVAKVESGEKPKEEDESGEKPKEEDKPIAATPAKPKDPLQDEKDKEAQAKKAKPGKLLEERKDHARAPSAIAKDTWKFNSEIVGPSQIVTYTSRFVDKLSDVTEALNVSGSLSIKYGAIGGSGKGQFIDSDKFRDSDLNFFIQVKVVNQTINLKDALVYRPLKGNDSLPKAGATGKAGNDTAIFNKIFGDTFISGFVEGGEFNALISMKIMDKSKSTDIAAKAKIALTIGAGSVEAEGEVKKQKSSLEMSTETTIQVSWAGGGHIKSFNEPWDIDSVTRAASRFPDLVARSPQRIYAIITKYETLRSFIESGPKEHSKLVYENATIYTNYLLDSFMDYKNIYKTLSTNMEEMEAGRFQFLKQLPLGDPRRIKDVSKFEASIAGLENARKAARFQMLKIVNEVDLITENPGEACKENRPDIIQSANFFRSRIPVQTSVTLIKPGKDEGLKETYAITVDKALDNTPEVARQWFNDYQTANPQAGKSLQVDHALGFATSSLRTTFFKNLEFLQPSFSIHSVQATMLKGTLNQLTITWTNGLRFSAGRNAVEIPAGEPGRVVLKPFPFGKLDGERERVFGCRIEVAQREGEAVQRVVGLTLYTSRGRDYTVRADKFVVDGTSCTIDGDKFTRYEVRYYDSPMLGGQIKGFWGQTLDRPDARADVGIYALGPIWG
ncbi:hypothetical protein K505DRAFT_291014, partial [Melanomma pulvis-pyrius CBS 109.77]